MNHDEFAFANQQLAAMLREGIPLEGAILRLGKSMRRGEHRSALLRAEELMRDGTPVETAVQSAKLPEFYCELIRLGVRSGDLPGALTLASDYYRRSGAVWTRLRALLTYPAIVLVVSMLLSFWFLFLYRNLHADLAHHLREGGVNVFRFGAAPSWFIPEVWPNLWIPPVSMAAIALLLLIIFTSRGLRSSFRWRLSPFKDAALAQLAAALSLLLRGGLTLREALAFAKRIDSAARIGRDLDRWMAQHAAGSARFSEIAEGSRVAPSLFIWIVSSAGENVAEGFAQAADLYAERARRRSEVLLNLVLPCALLFMGVMIMGQIQPFMTSVFDVFTPIFQAKEILTPLP